MLAEPSRRSLLKLGVCATASQLFSQRAASALLLQSNWQVGTNTAIEGCGLIQTIDTLRELGFTTIEIHPMGVPGTTC